MDKDLGDLPLQGEESFPAVAAGQIPKTMAETDSPAHPRERQPET